MDGGQTGRGSHLVAIAVQLLERLEGAGFQVGRYAIDHFVEIARRNPIAAHCIVKRGQHWMRAVTALQRLVERRAPLLDAGPVRACFVAQIVAIAHEGIHRAHGIALRARKQHERIVEVSGARARHATTVRVGILEHGHNAERTSDPSISQTRSALEMAGRRESTS